MVGGVSASQLADRSATSNRLSGHQDAAVTTELSSSSSSSSSSPVMTSLPVYTSVSLPCEDTILAQQLMPKYSGAEIVREAPYIQQQAMLQHTVHAKSVPAAENMISSNDQQMELAAGQDDDAGRSLAHVEYVNPVCNIQHQEPVTAGTLHCTPNNGCESSIKPINLGSTDSSINPPTRDLTTLMVNSMTTNSRDIVASLCSSNMRDLVIGSGVAMVTNSIAAAVSTPSAFIGEAACNVPTTNSSEVIPEISADLVRTTANSSTSTFMLPNVSSTSPIDGSVVASQPYSVPCLPSAMMTSQAAVMSQWDIMPSRDRVFSSPHPGAAQMLMASKSFPSVLSSATASYSGINKHEIPRKQSEDHNVQQNDHLHAQYPSNPMQSSSFLSSTFSDSNLLDSHAFKHSGKQLLLSEDRILSNSSPDQAPPIPQFEADHAYGMTSSFVSIDKTRPVSSNQHVLAQPSANVENHREHDEVTESSVRDSVSIPPTSPMQQTSKDTVRIENKNKEQTVVAKMLCDAIHKLCHETFSFNQFVHVSGSVSFNIDNKETALVDIDEKVLLPSEGASTGCVRSIRASAEPVEEDGLVKDKEAVQLHEEVVEMSGDGKVTPGFLKGVMAPATGGFVKGVMAPATGGFVKGVMAPATMLGEELVRQVMADSEETEIPAPVKKKPGRRGRKKKEAKLEEPRKEEEPVEEAVAPPPMQVEEEEPEDHGEVEDNSDDADWVPDSPVPVLVTRVRRRGRPPKASKKVLPKRKVTRSRQKRRSSKLSIDHEPEEDEEMKSELKEQQDEKDKRNLKFKCTYENCTYETDHTGHYRKHLNRHEGAKPHTCDLCKKTFTTADDLKRHEAIHSKKFACSLCNEEFEAKTKFKEHVMIKHQLSGKLFSCDYCKKSLPSSSELQKHLQEHHNHICSICGESFTGLVKLKQHRNTSHPQEALTCHICNKQLNSKGALKKHIYRHNSSRSYQCELCGKSFTAQSTLYHHKRGVHTNEKPYKCSKCDKSFNFHHSLKLHLLQHNGQRPFKCSMCEKSYLTSAHLKGHVDAVHSSLSHSCPICNKKFPYDNSLKMHMMLHTGTRPYKCRQCQRGFISKSALKTHEASHVTGKLYECDICFKKYKTEQLCRAHRRRHTEDGSRYMCDICGHTFMYKSNLEAHVEVHGNERKYSCDVCGKMFKTQATLYSHALVHKTDHPFTCTVCGKAFKSKDRVAAHEKRHLGLKPFACNICQRAFPDKGGLSKHQRTVHTDFKRFICPVCGKACSRSDNLRVHMKIHGDPSLLQTIKALPLPDEEEKPEINQFNLTLQNQQQLQQPSLPHQPQQMQLQQLEPVSTSNNSDLQMAAPSHQREVPYTTVAGMVIDPAQTLPTESGTNEGVDVTTASPTAPGTIPATAHMSTIQGTPDYMQVASSMLFMQYGFYSGQPGASGIPATSYNQNYN